MNETLRVAKALTLALGLALAGGLAAAPAQAVPAATATPAATPTRYRPDRFAGRAGEFYKVVWGIDALSVRLVESGEVIRFAWRVLDADRAGALNDKAATPILIDPRAGVSLSVPAVDNVGMLRQTQPAEKGRQYWMAFSNKGRLVKRGDRVDVVVGTFRAEGLVVD